MATQGRRRGGADEEDLKEQVAMCCRVLYSEGLMRNVGHLTLRIPGTDRFFLGFNRYTYGDTQAKDIITFDLSARKVAGPEVLLPYETFIYTEVLKARPDVNSVLHVHMPVTLAFGIAGREILPLYLHDSEVLRFGVTTVDNPLLASTVDRGQAIARALREASACHMRGHGQVIVGETAEQATNRAMQLEDGAKINLMALQLNPHPKTLTGTEMEEFVYENRRTPETSAIEPYSAIRKRIPGVALGQVGYLARELAAKQKARS
ncbi:MAG: class II aldolase/adducin family protein [Chloroflexi bacterium]|nr:class II aldolase/adducin family protein [Chloroflexota bacterium]